MAISRTGRQIILRALQPAASGVRPGPGWPIWIIAVHIMESVTLTQREMARLQVLNSLLAQQMTTVEAATLMGVSTRHTSRLLAAYREEGAVALAHGNRGRRPANATPDSVIAEIVHLARTRYRGTNHTHLSELLAECEGIKIGHVTIRRILTSQRQPPAHRIRRQRMPREGMLVQLVGSHHRWLGTEALSTPCS